MATFDINAYLNQRLEDISAASAPNKIQDIVKARQEKLFGLSEYRKQAEAEQDRMQQTAAFRRHMLLGGIADEFNPDSLTATATDLVTDATVSAYNLGRAAVENSIRNDANPYLFGLTDEHRAAMTRYMNNEASVEDWELLNQPAPEFSSALQVTDLAKELGLAKNRRGTILEEFQKAQKINEDANAFNKATDLDFLKNTQSTEQLQNELKQVFARNPVQFTEVFEKTLDGTVSLEDFGELSKDAIKALPGILRAGATNPKGLAQFLADTAPDLVAGAQAGITGLLATGGLRAAGNYNEGVQDNYEKSGNTELFLPQNEEAYRQAMGAAGAVADAAGNLINLRAIRQIGNAVSKGAKNAAADAASPTEAFKKSLLDRAGIASAAAIKGFAGESVTEGFQTVAESEAKGESATNEDIFVGAAIGGLMGGGLSGAGATVEQVGEVARDTSNAAAKRALERFEGTQRADPSLVEAARKSGDVSALVDQHPVDAASVLFERSQDTNLTEEERAASTEALENLSKTKQDELDRITDLLYTASLEGRADYANQAAELTKQLEALPAQDPQRAELENMLRIVENAANTPELPAQERKVLERRKNGLEKVMERLSVVQDAVAQEGIKNDTPEFVANDVTAIETLPATDNQVRAAVNRVIQRAMQGDSSIDLDTISRLASTPTNSLTDQERELLGAIAEARSMASALKDSDQVQLNILYGGGKKYPGIAQHRTKLMRALNRGNKTQATKARDAFNKFFNYEVGKARAIESALATVQNGTERMYVSFENGTWNVYDTPMSIQEIQARKKTNPDFRQYEIHAASGRFPEMVKESVEALSVFKREADLAYQNKFGQDNTGSATNTAVNTAATDAAVETTVTPQSEEQTTQESTEDVETDLANEEDFDSVAIESAAEQEATVQEQETVDDVDSIPPWEDLPEDIVETAPEQENSPVGRTLEELVSEDARLDVLTQVSAPDVPYNERNLVADFFKQVRAAKEGAFRPLATVKNFLTRVLDTRDVKPQLFLNNKELTDTQRRALMDFMVRAREWFPIIQSSLSRRGGNKAQYRYQDYPQYFLTETDGVLDLEENVKTAIAYAVYSYAHEIAKRGDRNDAETINQLMGRDTAVEPTPEEYQLYGRGVTRALLITQLGQRVVSALGMRAKGADTPTDAMPRLEASMGMLAFTLLGETELFKVQQVTTVEEIVEATQDGEEPSYNAVKELYVLDRNPDGTLGESVQAIVDANQESAGVVDSLFKAEGVTPWPSLEPIAETNTKAKRSNSWIGKKLKSILEMKQKEPWVVREDMVSILQSFNESFRNALIGVKPVGDNVPAAIRERNKATNDGLQRELGNLLEFAETLKSNPEGLKTPFYMEQVVWKNFRVGINSLINPQASKLQRYSIGQPSWESTVNLQDTDQLHQFLLQAALGLGIKADKQNKDATLNDLRAFIKDGEVKAALLALQDCVRQGKPANYEFSEADQAAISAAVIKGGEAMKSLDALIALSEYLVAKELNEPSFTTRMVVERDGVSNGPILLNLLLGAASSLDSMKALLRRGGFYSEADGVTQFHDWRGQEGNTDFYEDSAQILAEAAIALRDVHPSNAKLFSALWTVGGELIQGLSTGQDLETFTVTSEGRNRTKALMNPLTFGSGTDKAVGNFLQAMLDNYFKKLQEHFEKQQSGEWEANSHRDLVAAMNDLIGAKVFNPKEPVSKLKEKVLTPKHLAAFKENTRYIRQGLGKALRKAHAEFFKGRDLLSSSTNAMFAFYEGAWKQAKDAYIAELKEQGVLALNQKGNPIHDLTAAQQRELAQRIHKLLPYVHTAYSRMDGNFLAGGVYMAEQTTSTDLSKLEVEIQLRDPETEKESSKKANARIPVEKSPGVLAVSSLIHSFDSAVAMLTQESRSQDTGLLNLFDSLAGGFSTSVQDSQAVNKQLMDLLVEYSPLSNTYFALRRVLGQSIEMLGDSPTDKAPSVQGLVKGVLAALNVRQYQKGENGINTVDKTRGAFLAYLTNAKAQADAAERMKLEALLQMRYVGQYSSEGGSYELTDADYDAIQKRLDQITGVQDTAFIDSVDAVLQSPAYVQAMGDALQALESKATTVSKPVQQAPVSQVKTSPLQDLFAGAEQVTANQALTAVIESTRQNNKRIPSAAFLWKLASSLKDLPVLNGVNVQLVTPENMSTAVPAEIDLNGKLAVYVRNPDTNERTIFVKSRAFLTSGMRPDTITHELLHAVLDSVVSEFEANPDLSNPVHRQIAELQSLLQTVKEQLQANQPAVFAQYEQSALVDLHEFLAWGLTDFGFQKVLGSLEYKNTARQAPSSAFGKFVNTLFRTLKAALAKSGQQVQMTESALGEFLVASTLLLESAKTAPAPQGTNDLVVRAQRATPANVSSLSVLDSLYQPDTISGGFINQLRDVQKNIINALHGEFGAFKKEAQTSTAVLPEDVYAELVVGDALPFVESAAQENFLLSDQEAYVVEQVKAVMDAVEGGKESLANLTYKTLVGLYKEAQQRITPESFLNTGTWATASAQEKAQAQSEYDFVFKVGDPTAEYMSRFVALGLGSEKFNELLQFESQTGRRTSTAKYPLAQAIQEWFYKLLSIFESRLTKTSAGERADARLTKLVKNLVRIEANRLNSKAGPVNEFLDYMDASLSTRTGMLRNTVVGLANNPAVASNPSAVVRLGGKVVSAIADERTEALWDALVRLRGKATKGRLGTVLETLNYMRGPTRMLQALVQFTKNMEKERQTLIDGYSRTLVEGFVNKGEDLQRHHKEALTTVLLRTGGITLWNAYGRDKLRDLIRTGSLRKSEIKVAENEILAAVPKEASNFMLIQANALAHSLIHGGSKLEAGLLTNTTLIAQYSGIPQDQQANLIPVLDRLVSLRALDYTSAGERSVAMEVLGQEYLRTDGGNGIEVMLKIHEKLMNDAKTNLFEEGDGRVHQYYLPEIYDPKVDVVVVEASEVRDYWKKGYTQAGDVFIDPKMPQTQRVLMYRKGAGQPSRITGAISYTDLHRKGTSVNDAQKGFLGTRTDRFAIGSGQQASFQALKKQDPATFDPTKIEANYLVPVMDAQGGVIDYVYRMQTPTKQKILRRDSRFEKLLGNFAGNSYDKQATPKQNTEVIQALREHYKEEFKKNPYSFFEIGPDSDSEHGQELWRLLPEKAKDSVRSIWGAESMYVPIDMVNNLFGFAEPSVGNLFLQDKDSLSTFERGFVLGMEAIVRSIGLAVGKRGDALERFIALSGITLRKGEVITQEIGTVIKDTIVNKTGIVLAGNVYSNMTVLATHGVPITKAFEYSRVAWQGALMYGTNQQELDRLNLLLSSGLIEPAKEAQTRKEIARLESEQAKNPVKELIDAGMMPTIVEDVEHSDDTYSYESLLQEKVNKVLDKLPDGAVSVGKTLFMTHDTQLYKAMSRATQLSDFVARYALYKHLTETKGTDKESALYEISEAFVVYDLPLPAMLHWMDKMYVLPFLKYYLSIQRVLIRMGRSHPARTLMNVAFHGWADSLPSVLESSILSRGAPTSQDSFMSIFDAASRTMPIQFGLSAVK